MMAYKENKKKKKNNSLIFYGNKVVPKPFNYSLFKIITNQSKTNDTRKNFIFHKADR